MIYDPARSLAERVYRVMLLAYRPGFRQRYGQEMIEAFRDTERASPSRRRQRPGTVLDVDSDRLVREQFVSVLFSDSRRACVSGLLDLLQQRYIDAARA